MQWSGVPISDAFWAALQTGADGDLRDRKVGSAEEHFARALLRAAVGDDAGARSDLEAAQHEFEDAVRVELAMLDLRRRADLPGAMKSAREIAAIVDRQPGLRARALHVVGLGEAKRGRTGELR